MNRIKFILLITSLLISSSINAQLVSTIAGVLETPGFNDGQALSSRFFNPHGIAVDGNGNIYIADRYNHTVRKITVDGVVSTMAGKPGFSGSQDGDGETARFNEPWGICASEEGVVYVADTKNNKIRRIDLEGNVKTIAGTGNFGSSNAQGLAATFGNPTGIEIDDFGNIYVADHLTHIIRKIDNRGIVTTIAGIPYIPGEEDGFGREAQFWRPYGLTLDNDGNILVADEWNHKIRRVTPAGQVTTVAGNGEVGIIDGTSEVASFNYPWDMTVDAENNIYVADGYNYVIRKITPEGEVSSYAGTPLTSGGVDGVGDQATFSGATSIAWDEITGSLYVGDAYNHLVRMITTESKPNLSLINTTGKTEICQGEDFTVRAATNAFTNYAFYLDGILWQNGDSPLFEAPFLEAGTHQINAESFWGEELIESNTISVEVIASERPSVSVVGETSFYEGDSVILVATGVGDFLWTNGATTQTITVKEGGDYAVQVTPFEGGCPGISESINIIVLSDPVAAVITIDGNSVLCPNSTTTLISNYETGNQWLKDGWTIGVDTTNELVVSEAGFYQVQIIDPVTNVLVFSEAVEITVMDIQNEFDFIADYTNVQPGGPVNFEIKGILPQSFSWNFGDNDLTGAINDPNPTYQYIEKGSYDVRLLFENEVGCRDTLTKANYIKVAVATDLFVPTGFTPNGDGINDLFIVRGQTLNSYNLQIFNQWGGLLHSSKNQAEGWDGYSKGQPVDMGTYTYLIAYSEGGNVKYLSGHITLIN